MGPRGFLRSMSPIRSRRSSSPLPPFNKGTYHEAEPSPAPQLCPSSPRISSSGSVCSSSLSSSFVGSISLLSPTMQSHTFGDARKLVIKYFQNDNESSEKSSRKHGRKNSISSGSSSNRKKHGEPIVKARVELAAQSLMECVEQQLMEEETYEQDKNEGNDKPGVYGRIPGERPYLVHYVATSETPSTIDASEAIGLATSYITAYRVLYRAGRRPLQEHDSIFILNPVTSLGRAIVALAKIEGVRAIYGIAKNDDKDRLIKMGIQPVPHDEFVGMAEYFVSEINVMIDNDVGSKLSVATVGAHPVDGKVVRIIYSNSALKHAKKYRIKEKEYQQQKQKQQKQQQLEQEQHSERCVFYDIYRDMTVDKMGFRLDLQHLFNLLSEGIIKPKKKRSIPLLGISYIEVRFETHDPREDHQAVEYVNTRHYPHHAFPSHVPLSPPFSPGRGSKFSAFVEEGRSTSVPARISHLAL